VKPSASFGTTKQKLHTAFAAQAPLQGEKAAIRKDRGFRFFRRGLSLFETGDFRFLRVRGFRFFLAGEKQKRPREAASSVRHGKPGRGYFTSR
jgi:hypothetical protein